MISPNRRLLAAQILQVSAIAIPCAIDINHRNTAMQFFHVKIIFSLFYCLLFYRPLTGMHGDKRYVSLVNTCAFFLAVASNQCALTPAIRRCIFCQCRLSPHHVLAWFRMRGGKRHCQIVIGGAEAWYGKYLM